MSNIHIRIHTCTHTITLAHQYNATERHSAPSIFQQRTKIFKHNSLKQQQQLKHHQIEKERRKKKLRQTNQSGKIKKRSKKVTKEKKKCFYSQRTNASYSRSKFESCTTKIHPSFRSERDTFFNKKKSNHFALQMWIVCDNSWNSVGI